MADDNPTSRIIITAELQGKEKINQDLKSVTEGTKNLSESAKQATQSVKGLDNALKGAGQGGSQGIKESVKNFNDLATVTSRPATPLREMERVLNRVANTVDPLGEKARRLGIDLEKLGDIAAGSGEKALRASNLIIPATQKLAEFQSKTTVGDQSGMVGNFEKLSASAKRYLEELNPLISVQERYRERIKQTNELVQIGLITNAQASKSLADLAEKELTVSNAIKKSGMEQLTTQQITKQFSPILRNAQKDFVDYNSTSTRAFGLNRIGLLELQAAGINTFQALAAGMSPLRVATMEGAQAFGAFVQGGLKISTLVGIIAPLAAVGAAIFAVIHRVTTVTNNIRDFNLVLSTLASGSGQNTQGIQNIIDHFNKLGVSAADAKKSVLEVLSAQPQRINTGFTEDIVQLALDIQSIPGTKNAGNLPATVKDLTDALTGGIPALEKYGFELNALTAPEAAQIRDLARLQGAPAAVQFAFEKLVTFFAGKYLDSLTKVNETTISLLNTWNAFIKNLSESKFGGAISEQLILFLKDIESVVGGIDRLITNTGKFFDELDKFGRKISDFLPSLDSLTKKFEFLGNLKLPTWSGFVGQLSSNISGTTSGNQTVRQERSNTPNLIEGTARLSIGSGVNLSTSEDIRKLTDVLGRAIDTFPAGYRAEITSEFRPGARVSGTGGVSLHGVEGGRAVDVKIVGPEGIVKGFMGSDVTGTYRKLEEAVSAIQKKDYPELTNKMQFGTKFSDAGHFGVEGGRGISESASAASKANKVLNDTNEELNASLDKQEKKLAQNLEQKKKWGVEMIAGQARLEAERAEIEKGTAAIDPLRAGNIAAANAIAELNVEWGKQAVIARAAAEGAQTTADAFQENEVAGLKAAAAAEAYNLELTTNVPALQTYGQILTKNAVESVLGAQKEVTAFGQVLSASKRLADATKEGTAAAKDAELQNEAVRSTHDALNNAMALGNKTLEERAKRLQEQKLEQLRVNESLTQTTDLERETNNLRKESKVLALETNLTASGATRESIDKELANLRAILLVTEDRAFADEKSKNAHLEIVNALGSQKVKLAEVELSQRRINDIVLDIADNISTTLSDAIKAAFDGKKVTDWKDKLKDALRDVVSSLSDKMFVKPLLGTLAESLGLSSVGQSLGSLTGTGTGSTVTSSGLVTGTASTKSTTEDADLTNGISGNTSIGLVGLGASTGSTGSVKSWLNENIGPLLGFAKPAKTVSTEDADLVGTTTTVSSGSSLTSALGSTATGVGVGGLTSSLLGGNATTGSLVGGALSLGGNLLFPGVGSLVTGLAGGAIGGLVSLFGNNKTSNNAAGANLNLTTGKISGTVSSKDEASNQDVEDITGSVRSFARDLAKETGETVGGSISVQSGLRDGIKVGFAGSLSNLGEKVYESAQDAIDDIELQLAKNLDGLSNTAKTVLDQLTDPADIQDALDFAKAYDNLKEASDSAFSGIETDTKAQGAYADAMDLLTEKFDDLTVSAEEFGLSLDPINKGLDEATKRLQEDFGKSLDSALDASKANDFLNTLQDVSDAFVSNTKEAKAIGLDTDTTTTDKIAKLEVSAARETLDTLSTEDLQKVVDELADTAPEISKLAQSLIDLGSVSSDATDFLNDLDASLNLSKGKDFINTLQDVSDAFVDNVKKANDLGLNDSATALKLSAVEVEAANSTLKTLTKGELEDVVSGLADSAPEISALAQDILNLGTAVDDTSESVVKLADGIKSIKDLASDLRTGKLSGLTDTSAAKSAIKQYDKDLTSAQAAGVNVTGNQLDKLAESGTAAIDASLKAYGNAPKTAELRRQVLKDLDAVLALADTAKTVTGTVISTKVANKQWDILNKTVADAVVDTTDIPTDVATEQTKIRDDTLAEAAAGGSMGTKAGKILVGEKGPEWMLPGYAVGTLNNQMIPGYGKGTERWKDWQKVGMGGPEIINQNGGAVILPFPMHPKNLPHYAEGTNDFGFISEPSGTVLDTLNTNDNSSDSMDGVVVELRGLRRDNRSMKDELAALKKQIQGGQTQANVDARKGNSTLSSINNKLGSGLTSVTRRSVG